MNALLTLLCIRAGTRRRELEGDRNIEIMAIERGKNNERIVLEEGQN